MWAIISHIIHCLIVLYWRMMNDVCCLLWGSHFLQWKLNDSLSYLRGKRNCKDWTHNSINPQHILWKFDLFSVESLYRSDDTILYPKQSIQFNPELGVHMNLQMFRLFWTAVRILECAHFIAFCIFSIHG